jgi:hypothetical protein
MKKLKLIFALLTFAFSAFGQAQLELPYSIKVLNPKPLDGYYYNSSFAPYTSTSQVTSQVTSAVRYRGQTFNINGVEYWFGAGIADGDLVIKSAGSLSNALSVDNSSLQLNSGTAFDGSAARTISIKNLGITNAMIANGTIDLATKASAQIWWGLSGTSTYTAPVTISGTSTNTLKFQFNSLATTQTNGAGLWLQNSTSAALNAQQISPSITWEGQGWRSQSTAASQSVKFTSYVLPAQGLTAPTGSLNFDVSINGGAYSSKLKINSVGTITIPGSIIVGSSLNLSILDGIIQTNTIPLSLSTANQTININSISETGSIRIGNGSTTSVDISAQTLNFSGTTDAGSSLLWDDGAVNSGILSIGTFGAGLSITTFDAPAFGGENMILDLESGQIFITDNRTSKAGVLYNANGYVTQPQSLSDKQYVDEHLKGLTYTNSPSSGTVPTYNGTNITWSLPAGGFTNTAANNELMKSNGTSAVPSSIFATSDGRLYGTSLHNNSGSVTGTTNQYIASGTYTPTVSGVSGLDTNTPRTCQWIRVGNVVNISGIISATKAANGSISFQISLPITSSFSTAYKAGGAAAWNPVAEAGSVACVNGGSTLQIQIIGALAGSGDITFTAQYEIL